MDHKVLTWGVMGSLAVGPLLAQNPTKEAVRQKLDLPPGPTQKPYQPADDQVVEVTPPPFIWVPFDREAVYALQVSPSEEFPEGPTRTFRGLRRPVYVPREPLPPGRWFWRYGVETEAGPVYGRARPFTIPENARSFPFPQLLTRTLLVGGTALLEQEENLTQAEAANAGLEN